jgi:cytoskeletal protein RodZ
MAAYTHTDILTRVRREQRLRGKSSGFSGLRIVLTATAITVAILLFAFGAIGMLMMARSPQQPIASRLDPAPLAQAVPETANPEPQANLEPEVKSVKTQRIVSPAPPAAEVPDVKQELAAQPAQVPSSEPETTAAIPNPAAQAQQQAPQVSQNATRQQPAPQQQHAVRRPVPDSQSDNPLFQLFGIKKYR